MRKSVFATFTAAAAVAAALLLTGCERAVNMTGKPVEFSAGISDGRSESGTRVVYGEITGTGTKSQSLDWEIGDKLTIYCAQCTKVQTDVESAKHVSDYVVTEVDPDETGSDSYAAIGNPGPDVEGLQWGDDVEHVFYAVYPKTSISGRTITGTIPQIQSVKSVSETASKVAAPYMTSMYMVSKTVVPASKVGDDVTLVFQPLTTALEFTVTNKFDDTFSAMIVNSISLVSTGHALSGGFAVDMDQNGSYGRPKTTLASGTTVADNNTVTIDFGEDPVTVAYGKTLNFTFFLNPGNDTEVDDLTFVINGSNAGNSETFTRRAKLENSSKVGIIIPTHQKTIISGLMVPEGVAWTVNYTPTVEQWNNGGNTPSNPEPLVDDSQPVVTSWDTDIDDELMLTDPYNGHEYVEIGGIKWATCNVGANTPKDYGWYFSWAGTTGYVRDGSKWVTAQGGSELSGGFCWAKTPYNTGGVKTSWNKYIPTDKTGFWTGGGSPDNKLSLDLEDDAARANWGGSWRMPTQADYQALYEACGGTGPSVTPTELPSANPSKGIYSVSKAQTYISDYTGVAGLLFCDGTNKLFFVAAGYGVDASFKGDGSGRYWLGTVSSTVPSSAYYLSFIMPGKVNCENINDRYQGYTVRPVSD
ncbi:MAG: hypothetical protein MJZ06_09355 [Bacteroidaceae bacterium]|nr:hypothetical protein [Bacteroidaceae bacterium]